MANWDEIKQEWETTKITLADLAEKHDIKLGTLKSRKSREKWSRDATKKGATKTVKVATIKEDASKDEIVYFNEDDGSGLNDKQRLFVAYYVQCWNATKAYKKAYPGCAYSTAMVEGSKHLRNPKIREEIIRVRDGLTEDALLDKRTLIQKWIDIAFANITDYVKFGKQGGSIFVYLSESTEIDGTLITEVKQSKDGVSIKLADKMKAMEFLTKHMDLLNEKERKQLQIEKAKVDIELSKIAVRKENGDAQEEFEDDGFLEALKGTEVNWDE